MYFLIRAIVRKFKQRKQQRQQQQQP